MGFVNSILHNSWKLFLTLKNPVALQGQVFYLLHQDFHTYPHFCKTIMQSSEFVGLHLVNLGREPCISVVIVFHLCSPLFSPLFTSVFT